jgi:hypothetical protein
MDEVRLAPHIPPIITFISNNHVGAVFNNWGTSYDKSYKPGITSWIPSNRQITDYQSLALAEYSLHVFKSNGFPFRYQDIGSEKLIYNNITRSIPAPPIAHIDMFMTLLYRYRGITRRVGFQSTKGGSISHSLTYPHRGVYMLNIGSTNQITAIPDPGYKFTGWSGNISSLANPITFVVGSNDAQIQANFVTNGSPPATNVSLTAPYRYWDIHEVKEYTFVDKAWPNSNFATNALTTNYHAYNYWNTGVTNVFIITNTEVIYARPYSTKSGSEDSTNYVKNAYLKFNITNVPDTNKIAYASLKYYVHKYENETSLNFDLYEVGSGWSADTLTWNNAPADGPLLSTINFNARSVVNIEHDITGLIKANGNGTYAFKIATWVDSATDRLGDLIIYSSKSNGGWRTDNKPLLYIAWDEQLPSTNTYVTQDESEPMILVNNIPSGSVIGGCITPEIDIWNYIFAWTNMDGVPYDGNPVCGEGSHTLQVIASNTGYPLLKTNITYFDIDTIPPAITVNRINDSDYYPSGIWADIQISDLHPLTNWALLNGSAYNSGEPIPEGVYTLKVYALDLVNNQSSNIINFSVDETFPILFIDISGIQYSTNRSSDPGYNHLFAMSADPVTVTIDDIKAGNNIFSAGVSVNISAKDSNLAYTDFRMNNEPYISGTPLNDEGTYNFTFIAKDIAGNETLETFTINVVSPVIIVSPAVNVPPVVNVKNLDSKYYTKCVYGEIEANDADLGPDSISVKVFKNGSSYNPKVEIIKTDDKQYKCFIKICENGSYLVNVNVKDKAGNITKKGPYKFMIKLSVPKVLPPKLNPPQINISGVEDGECYTNDVEIDVQISGDVKSSYISLNGESKNNHLIVSDESRYRLEAGATDNAGNTALSGVDFVIDKTPPVVKADGIENNGISCNPDIKLKIYEDIVDIEKSTVFFDTNEYNINPATFENGEDGWEVNITGITDLGFHKLEYDIYDCTGLNSKDSLRFGIFPCFISSNILFYAGYDNGLNADYAVLDRMNKGRGILSEHAEKSCVKIDKAAGVPIYQGANNFYGNNNEGTISFWVKTDWTELGANEERNILTVKQNAEKSNGPDSKAVLQILARGKWKTEFHLINAADEKEKLIINQVEKGNKKPWFGNKEWTHIVLTWNYNQEVMKAYINGNESKENKISKTIKKNGDLIILGAEYNADNEKILNGKINNLIILDKAITKEEALKLLFE